MGRSAGPDPVSEMGLGAVDLDSRAALQPLWLHSDLLQLLH